MEAYRYLAQADLALESGDLDVGELLGFADALLAGAGASAEQMGQGRSALHTEQARGFVARAFEATTRRDVAAARRAIQAGAAEVNEARAQNLDRGDASLVQGAGAR